MRQTQEWFSSSEEKEDASAMQTSKEELAGIAPRYGRTDAGSPQVRITKIPAPRRVLYDHVPSFRIAPYQVLTRQVRDVAGDKRPLRWCRDGGGGCCQGADAQPGQAALMVLRHEAELWRYRQKSLNTQSHLKIN